MAKKVQGSLGEGYVSLMRWGIHEMRLGWRTGESDHSRALAECIKWGLSSQESLKLFEQGNTMTSRSEVL